MLKRIKSQNGDAFYTRERCFITELLNHADSPGLSIARCCVKPAVMTELHRLKATHETYLIEQGEGEMDDANSPPIPVAAGDCVTISPGQAQRIRNIGQDDLVFQVICSPRFRPECYEPLEPDNGVS